MGRKIWVILITTLLLLSISRMVFAEETKIPEKVSKIERVRWSGLQFFGLKIFGSWAEAPEEPSLFGAVSPYFRLNDDDKTVFRWLGRESNFGQKIFPALHSRENLRQVISKEDMANRSLIKFDSQVASGEKINMVSTGLSVGGKVAIVTGVIMMFASLGDESEFGETPPMLKNGYAVAGAGIVVWAVGEIGQLAGAIVTKQSFSHLGDAMRHYNKSQ